MPQPSHARDARNLLVLSVVTAGFLDGALRWGGGLPGVMSERDDFGTGLLQAGGGSTQSHSAAVLPGGGETRGCKSDSECKAINSEWVCEGPASRGVCRHKHLLPLIDSADVAMLLLVFITIFISVPVGVGGGGILISIFLVVGRFCPHGAIPLTPPAIFGGALSNALLNVYRRHPNSGADRPLIDYEVLMMFAPYLMLSISAGVTLNGIMPAWIITLLLVGFFSYVTMVTTRKAIDLYIKQEGRERQLKPGEEESRLLLEPADNAMAPKNDTSTRILIRDAASTGAPETWTRPDHCCMCISVVLATWLITSASSILKGSPSMPGLVQCGSRQYWAIMMAPYPLVLVAIYFASSSLISSSSKLAQIGIEPLPGDIVWTRRNAINFALFSMAAGLAVGSLGIAAGMILGPLLLEAGLMPQVSVATTGLVVLFTSSSTAFQYWISGQMVGDYALVLVLVSLAAGALGNLVLNYLVDIKQESWFIVAILAAMIGVTNVLTLWTGLENLSADLAAKGAQCLYQFGAVCAEKTL